MSLFNKTTLLNVLLIDDNEDQLFLIEDELVQAGFLPTLRRVDTADGLHAALSLPVAWHIALLDYSMPLFSAEQALLILGQQQKDIPVIVVSGQTSEEIAIKLIKSGARDYISKQQRGRLVPAIIRELEDRALREIQILAELKLHEIERKLAIIAMAAHEGILLLTSEQKIDFWNQAASRITGYNETEVLGKDFSEFFIPERFRLSFQQQFQLFQQATAATQQGIIQELIIVTKTGDELMIELSLSAVIFGQQWTGIGIIHDVSQQKQRESELKQQAIYDPLTGLYNRREFIMRMNKEINRAQRYHHPLSIFFIDVDYFKAINDRFGHPVGDKVLCELAQLLKKFTREQDICGRYGGEEFLIVLPETTWVNAMQEAERLRLKINQLQIELEDYPPLTISVSIGVAEMNVQCGSLENLINQADKAMYQAKQSGRNQVCVAQND